MLKHSLLLYLREGLVRCEHIHTIVCDQEGVFKLGTQGQVIGNDGPVIAQHVVLEQQEVKQRPARQQRSPQHTSCEPALIMGSMVNVVPAINASPSHCDAAHVHTHA